MSAVPAPGARPDKAIASRPLPVRPFLWIVTAGKPRALVARLRLATARGWPAGVYLFGDEVLRVGLVVACELPRKRTTLLVRLMAAGALLPDAVEDLSKLPADAIEHAVADEILLALQHALADKPSLDPLEQEFDVTMRNTMEKMREAARKQGKEEGLTQGQAKGQAQGLADALLTVLRARRVQVTATARKRILAEKSPTLLERWLKRASVAASLDEVLGEPS